MLKAAHNRRKAERHYIDRFAKIQGRVGTLPRDCLIVDISDSGIRLHAENVDVPDEFMIVITGVAQGRRDCRVVWRLGFEIGAEFTDVRRGYASNVAAVG
jgi:hypothetical protein